MQQVLVNHRFTITVPEHVAAWDALSDWERCRFDSMEANLAEGDTLFDIGAEQGYLSVIYARFVGGANMVLIEPVAEVWPNIRLTYEANGLGIPRACFVGFLSEETNLHPANLAPSFSGGKHHDDWPEEAWGGELHTATSYRLLWHQTFDTPQTTLDDFVIDSGVAPDALTIDVEGAELSVLRGGEGVLSEYRPKVWVSIHEDMMQRHHGHDAFDLLRLMHRHGYTGDFLGRDHESHWAFWP